MGGSLLTAPLTSKPDTLAAGRLPVLRGSVRSGAGSGGRRWFDPHPWRAQLGLTSTAQARRAPVDPLRESWCDYLAGWQFDLWVTLTYRERSERGKGRLDVLTPEAARESFVDLKGYIHRKTGHWPYGVLVLDYGARGDRLHIHALLARCGGVRRLSVMDYWQGRYGIARVSAYNPLRGARGYLAGKYLSGKVEIEPF